MQELAKGWEDRLRNDLTGFADRGADPLIEREENTLSAEWTTRGRTQSEIFGVNPRGELRWLSGPNSDDPYQDFLRSEGLADFAQMASSMKRAFPRFDLFIPGDAMVNIKYPDRFSVSAAPEVIAELVDAGRKDPEGRTNLYFLKGDPGAGKTTLLKEMTGLQAERYLAGDSDFLLFYVSAQGRELSNLRDAFSGELQDLRAGFTRDAIAALARNGLLIPVVDGFDELLGTAGYGGAFSSLQSLLAELEGLGAIVVSARSAFYDLEFLGRSSSPVNDADISLTTIDLEPWTDQQLGEYLGSKGDPVVAKALEELNDPDRTLLRRPFFASEFPDFALAAQGADGKSTLLEHLIDAYIEREAEKIVDSNGDPVLPVDGHHRLFELTASQMWEEEARRLSLDDLRTFTEIVVEEFNLEGDEAKQLATKVTSYAGFRPGYQGSREEFSFEHEVYFDHFLAEAAARFVREGKAGDLGQFADRAVIPETVVNDALDSLDQLDGAAQSLAQCPAGARYENRRRNFGAFLAGCASRAEVADIVVRDLTFVDLSMGRACFRKVIFEDCEFRGSDMSEVTFSECKAENCRFHALSLGEGSRFDITGLVPGKNVSNIRYPPTGDLFAPKEVLDVLRGLGLPTVDSGDAASEFSDHAQDLIRLLNQAARAYLRTNILYENDEFLQSLFQDENWQKLKGLLVQHEVVGEEIRTASGPRAKAFRLRVPVDQLVAGQTARKANSGPVVALWKALREI